MHTCPICKVDLPDRLTRCPKCDGMRGRHPARRVVFQTRELLKERFEKQLMRQAYVIANTEPLPEDTELWLELVLPEDAGTIDVTGRVVTARERSNGGAAPWALQLRLLDFDAEKQATIRDLLASEPDAMALDLEQEVGDTSLAGLVSRWDFSEPAEDS
ncbi:MAG: hypothetical protein OEM05_17465 [Myxococcales bacterium]|nr:hypothetical protein [Myxococcales bacterium]